MSPKFSEAFIALRTLVFDGRQGAYPTSVEQQFCGPLIPGGLCASLLHSRSPRIRRWGPSPALAPHSFASASPLQGPSQSRISTQDPGQTFPLGCYVIIHAQFSPGGGGATGLLAAPGRPPGTTRTQFPRGWGAYPRLRTPDVGLPRPGSGKPLRLMRPGCFRFAFALSSPQLGRLRKNKVGVKSACPDKNVAETSRFSRKQGRG